MQRDEAVNVDTYANQTSTEQKAIYQLQIIKVNEQRHSIYFDSCCDDFVSRQQAVNQLGD